MNIARCMLEPIAERKHCSLLRCRDCGSYQLAIGPVSIRLLADLIEELSHCLNQVQKSLPERPTKLEAVPEGLRTKH